MASEQAQLAIQSILKYWVSYILNNSSQPDSWKKKKKKKGQEAVILVKRAACAQLREGHIPNI